LPGVARIRAPHAASLLRVRSLLARLVDEG